MTTPTRQPGLDLARAVAITAVLVCHMLVLMPSEGLAGTLLTYLGESGVNLFFALSGFLIGRIALRSIHTARDVWHFWSRRWFRTLPAGLAVALVLGVLLHPGIRSFLATITFTRGAVRSSMQSPFLPHYWSLAVEEWAYLLLPGLLLAIGRTRRLPWLCAVWLALAVLHVVVARAFGLDYWQQATLTWMRLDAILAGVIVAEAEPLFRGRVASVAGIVGWAGVATLFAILALDPPYPLDRIAHYCQASVVPALFAITMPAMSRWRPTRAAHGVEWRAVQGVAALTYAVYLVHWDVYQAASRWIGGGTLVQISAALIASGGAAWVLHVAVERPGMQWRDRQQVKPALS